MSLFKNPCFLYADYDWPMKFSVLACDNFLNAPLPFECPLQDLILNSIDVYQRIPEMSRIKWEIEKALQSTNVSTDVLALIKAYVHIEFIKLSLEGQVFDLGKITANGYKLKMKITKLIDCSVHN
jgi:hypothetical protein